MEQTEAQALEKIPAPNIRSIKKQNKQETFYTKTLTASQAHIISNISDKYKMNDFFTFVNLSQIVSNFLHMSNFTCVKKTNYETM